jgi:hypothetical protein
MSDMPPGALAQPGPVGFEVRAFQMPDGNKVIMLRIEHTTGTTIISMPSEGAKALAKKLDENASGLLHATAADMPRAAGT